MDGNTLEVIVTVNGTRVTRAVYSPRDGERGPQIKEYTVAPEDMRAHAWRAVRDVIPDLLSKQRNEE